MNPWVWIGAGGLLLLGGGVASIVGEGPDAFIRDMRVGLTPYGLNDAAMQIVIAQAAFESGWGKSTPAKLGNNIFNVTRAANDSRPIIESGDQECDADGNCTAIIQRFAKYASLAEALAEYFALLSSPKYASALTPLYAGDAASFAAALRAGGYFTLPLAQYQSRLASVLASVQSRWA